MKDSSNEDIDNNKSKSSKDQNLTEFEQLPKWKQSISNMLENKYYTIFITILILFALFGDDLRLAAFSIGSDDYFYVLTCISLVIFTIEIIL